MNKSHKKAIKKMFDMVGEKDMSITKEPLWFEKHTWTEKQQDEFREWFKKQLDDKEFMQGVLQHPNFINEKIKKRSANEFILNFGWKVKN